MATTKFYSALPGGRVTVEDPSGDVRSLVHHPINSPDGHNWGYNGSGPTDLARDILWDHLGQQPALLLVHDFRSACVAKIPQDRMFELDGAIVASYILQWQNENPGFPLSGD